MFVHQWLMVDESICWVSLPDGLVVGEYPFIPMQTLGDRDRAQQQKSSSGASSVYRCKMIFSGQTSGFTSIGCYRSEISTSTVILIKIEHDSSTITTRIAPINPQPHISSAFLFFNKIGLVSRTFLNTNVLFRSVV